MRPLWQCQAKTGKTYLQLTSVLSRKEKHQAAKRHQNIQAILIPRSEHFPDVRMRSSAGKPVNWQGNNYPPGVLPADHFVRGILWELYNLNFAYELLSLDRCACSESNLVRLNDLQLVQRQSMISKCFPVDPFFSRSLPERNCGLAAHDIEEHLPFILRLVCVMQSWKGDKPPIFNLAAWSYHEIPGNQALMLEDAATKYYCQPFFFFDYFGCAALVPHCLFMLLINLAGFM